MSKFIKLKEIVKEINQDSSHVARVFREHSKQLGVIKVKDKDTKKLVYAIPREKLKDLGKLLPVLELVAIPETEMTIQEAAKFLSIDVSGLRKSLIKYGFDLVHRKGENGGKAKVCVKKKDLEKFCKETNRPYGAREIV